MVFDETFMSFLLQVCDMRGGECKENCSFDNTA